MELTIRSGYVKIGEVEKRGGDHYLIVEILSTQKRYELDGVTYDSYPGSEPDMEWTETKVRARRLSDTELDEMNAARKKAIEAKVAKHKSEEAERRRKEAEQKDRFERFLRGENVPDEIWSGYDLPRHLNIKGGAVKNPLKSSPGDYKGRYVGNGWGYDCKNSDALENLFMFIFSVDHDLSPERVEYFSREKVSPADGSKYYLAGAEYCRWIVARNLLSKNSALGKQKEQ